MPAPDLPPGRPLICLVGLRGAGKSTLGARLAAASGRAFVDLDRAVEGRAGRSIRALFEEQGEAGFRALEARTLAETLALFGAEGAPPAVIATGGGVVERSENRALLRPAFTIYLAASPDVLAARVTGDASSDRPALSEGGPLAEAQALFARRDPLYREVADAVIDASGAIDEVLAALLARVAPGAP